MAASSEPANIHTATAVITRLLPDDTFETEMRTTIRAWRNARAHMSTIPEDGTMPFEDDVGEDLMSVDDFCVRADAMSVDGSSYLGGFDAMSVDGSSYCRGWKHVESKELTMENILSHNQREDQTKQEWRDMDPKKKQEITKLITWAFAAGDEDTVYEEMVVDELAKDERVCHWVYKTEVGSIIQRLMDARTKFEDTSLAAMEVVFQRAQALERVGRPEAAQELRVGAFRHCMECSWEKEGGRKLAFVRELRRSMGQCEEAI